MAKVEALKITLYFKCDLPTKTGSFVLIHTLLLFPMMHVSWGIVQRGNILGFLCAAIARCI
ncbi:MAG: hypothetical protein WC136_01845 [Sphaerochaeta sp.]